MENFGAGWFFFVVVVCTDSGAVRRWAYAETRKICFSPKVPIQPCKQKSDSAPPAAIWAQFKPKPKQPHQKAIPANAGTHFNPWV